MFLSKLELFGFKSFATKTELNFNGGITSVVGPNGCGKTNVLDAIRWVLGEQRTSMLRSDSMENVIFNGSKDRKPLGMAEVTITIKNDKGLPTGRLCRGRHNAKGIPFRRRRIFHKQKPVPVERHPGYADGFRHGGDSVFRDRA